MEQIENDRKKVLDLINPIIEKHDEYETNILFLEKHLEIIKLFILTTNDVKYKVYSESENDSESLNSRVLHLSDIILEAKDKLKKKLEDAVELKDNYQKDYKAYGDCVRKLEQFKLIVSEKENDDEVSNSESQRLLLMVKRIQKTKEQLNKCSSKCIKELTDIKNEHNNVYNALLVDFKNIKTGLLNRI